jgi:hypothetical protein
LSSESKKLKNKNAWKPMTSNFLSEGFDKIKPSPKLQKIISYTKIESPLKKDPK